MDLEIRHLKLVAAIADPVLHVVRELHHPDAEAVKIMGWAGLLPTILPWIQAFIWAFKPTDIVDIRRFPKEEAKALDEEMTRLKDEARPSGRRAPTAREPVPPRESSAPPRAPDESKG
jgi:hypothetical protein